MAEDDIFGELDNRTEEAGGDFADWWDPDEPGEELVGAVVEMHSAPQEWTDAGEVPDTIYTVVSVGRGDVPEGTAVTPKQHKQLKQALAGTDIGDLVQLGFTGYQKVDGQPQPMMTYEVGTIPRNEWEQLDGADEIQDHIDSYQGAQGDNRRTTPYGQANDSQQSGGQSGGQVEPDDSELGQAASALAELVSIQGGEVDLETAENIITEVRGFDVDIEETIMYAGLTEEDGDISQ